MNFGIYSYAATVFIFCGAAFLVYLIGLFSFAKDYAVLSKADWKRILWTMVIMALASGPGEWVALRWHAWSYNPARTFNTRFLGAEVESYLFITLVALVVSIATLVCAQHHDQKEAKLKSS